MSFFSIGTSRNADMAAKLSRYVFSEYSTLRHFLLSVCMEYSDPSGLLYICAMPAYSDCISVAIFSLQTARCPPKK